MGKKNNFVSVNTLRRNKSLLCAKNGKMDICEKQCSHPLSINCTSLGAVESGRCCLKENTVLGLDLSSCHITSITNMFQNLPDLQTLYLQNNSIQIPKIEAYLGLTHLTVLKLPPKLDCPGGPDLWNMTEHTSEAVICTDELSTCIAYKVTCPNKNSHCVDIGPQITECLCNTGYHGYKCLRKGTFPTTAFVIGLCVSTVVISGLLWMTQRRKAKKQV